MRVWSKEPPSEAGWYWVEWNGCDDAEPCFLRENGEWSQNLLATMPDVRTPDRFGPSIPSTAELAAMEACVEALRQSCVDWKVMSSSDGSGHADVARHGDAALAALDEAREESK